MMAGDASEWAGKFTSVDDRLLNRIVAVWPKCVALLPKNPSEDSITINLVELLLKDDEVRAMVHWIEFQFEVRGWTAEGLVFSKGITDMGVLLEQSHERYLAYECKRLNVLFGTKIHSLATPYVDDGLMRFVTQQYSEDLPTGGMLGYVLDGNCAKAQASVWKSISTLKAKVAALSDPVALAAIHSTARFVTRHTRQSSGKEIEVRHALLPFPST